VVYAKASQNAAAPQMTRPSVSFSTSKQSGGAPITFKVLFAALVICGLYFGYSYFSGKTGVGSASIISSVGASLRSEKDNLELITSKKAELKAYEDGLQQTEADIAKMKSEVGTCPITGQPNQFSLKEDPRPELQAKIEKLKAEIKQLEKKS
jgi:cell division protein FtsB